MQRSTATPTTNKSTTQLTSLAESGQRHTQPESITSFLLQYLISLHSLRYTSVAILNVNRICADPGENRDSVFAALMIEPGQDKVDWYGTMSMLLLNAGNYGVTADSET